MINQIKKLKNWQASCIENTIRPINIKKEEFSFRGNVPGLKKNANISVKYYSITGIEKIDKNKCKAIADKIISQFKENKNIFSIEIKYQSKKYSDHNYTYDFSDNYDHQTLQTKYGTNHFIKTALKNNIYKTLQDNEWVLGESGELFKPSDIAKQYISDDFKGLKELNLNFSSKTIEDLTEELEKLAKRIRKLI